MANGVESFDWWGVDYLARVAVEGQSREVVTRKWEAKIVTLPSPIRVVTKGHFEFTGGGVESKAGS